ncbi:MAG: Spi family protease inhibitor [Muribaculaceae bacterium]|nr:Spi family protease inhibitor [Muribaculaceae bacterium]
MKKEFFFSLAMSLLMVGCSSNDEPQPTVLDLDSAVSSSILTPSEACSRAAEAYAQFHGQETQNSRSAKTATATPYKSGLSRGEDPALYVVEFEEGGFAVVNAYRNALTKLYAVVEEGNFDDTNNSGLRYYMEYATERAQAENSAIEAGSSRAVGVTPNPITPVYPPITIESDRLIGSDSLKIHSRICWSRNTPFNIAPGQSSPYNLGSLATAMASLAAYYMDLKTDLGVETLRYGGTRYVFDWFEMLKYTSYSSLSTSGKSGVREFLHYMQTYIDNEFPEYMEDGQFLSHQIVPEALSAIMNETIWFNGCTKYSRASISEIRKNLNDHGPQMMYGETVEKTIGDVWLIRGVKINEYEKEIRNYQDPITGEYTGVIYQQYEMTYVYFDWCLEGRSNGWFSYDGRMDFCNNLSGLPGYDPSVNADNYDRNIICLLDISSKKN